MANDVITVIRISRLGREFLVDSRDREEPRSVLLKKRQVLRILASMGESFGTSDGLALNEQFLMRFVEAWGGSRRKAMVREMLDILGELRDFAVGRGYLPPSGSEGQPLPMPAPLLRPRRKIVGGGRTPTPDEFDPLVAILMVHSRPWIGARLVALLATIMLAKPKSPSEPGLSLDQAIHIRKEDVDLRAGSIRIRGRADQWHREVGEFVYFGDVLREILARWLPRTCCEWAFPNQTRESNWNNKGAAPGCRTLDSLRDAYTVLGTPAFTLVGLMRLGERDGERLSDPHRSPFRLAPDGLELRAENIPISELREKVKSPLPLARTFDFMESALGDAAMTFDLTPRLIPKIEALMREDDPDKELRPYLKRHLNLIFCEAIRLGHLDEYPFAGRYKLILKGRWPGLCRPVRDKPSRPYRGDAEVPPVEPARKCPVELVEPRPEPSPWDDWDANLCPVHVRDDGHLIVFEKEKRRLRSRDVIRMVAEIARRYPDGGFDLPGLTRRFGVSAGASFRRLKEIDDDCRAAFQSAGVKNASLYRFGRPDD